MTGHRPFSYLATKGFSPARRRRVAAKAVALREQMTLNELRKSRRQPVGLHSEDTNLKNIELFNDITAWLFGELYAKHPVDCAFNTDDLPQTIRERLVEIDGDDDYGRFWSGTTDWLERHGFIAIEAKISDTQIEGVTLTLEGFRALSAVPSSLRPSETIGAELAGYAKHATSKAGDATIGQLVGTVLGAATKAFTQ